jgi:hypothetical protein
VLVVDLYSGCGVHGRLVAKALRQVLSLKEESNFRLKRGTEKEIKKRPVVLLLSIDKQQACDGTSLVVDARGLTKDNISFLKGKVPNMAVVLLASPPCTEYSIVNTKPGERDLESADALVRIVRDCHVGLDAVCTVMENPAAPGLLPSRNVASFLVNTCVVNYCAHGGMFFKKTQLWSGPKKIVLQRSGFQPKLCGGDGVCPIMLFDAGSRRWLHPQWVGTSLKERQSIPSQLSRSVGGAIAAYMNQVGKI